MQSNATSDAAHAPPQVFYRHRLPVRLMHWVNVISFSLMLMSGLGIFNAHPNLYWGKDSYSVSTVTLLSIGATQDGAGNIHGVTRTMGRVFDTDGVLGASKVLSDATPSARAFPSWATIPSRQSLATARHWHLFFAWIFVLNGIAYIAYAIFSGHLRRDMLPTMAELRNIPQSIKEHLLLKHPTGDAAKRYNVLQNIAYLVVIFGLLPLVVLGGFGLSPSLNALFDGAWIDLMGGRQSARTLHFLAAFGLVMFIVVHVFEVIITGLWNNLRSMITGNYRVPQDPVKNNEGKPS
jgi:thiosulfate reductase cytochrome b subunit